MKNIKDIHISLEESLSPKGRPYRLSGIKNGEIEKWVSGELRKDTYYTFKYLDDNTYFVLHVDPYGNILSKKTC